ncbi:hypothetical protein FA15DRAFT_95039 [Coprinopsis marcescibilis]|uniref:Uncharacterized protein n=1 Tax=Coprinopsis marcescibilis TaxID=230819 RepID=A0A5C3KLK2_COPMA|nr:hypothetical protein FA15DRAFT_95039 [Coprinopsis marcescibilis]
MSQHSQQPSLQTRMNTAADAGNLLSTLEQQLEKIPLESLPQAKSSAQFLNTLAGVSTFLSSVEVGYIQFALASDPSGNPEKEAQTPTSSLLAWKALKSFAFLSLLLSVLGAVFSLMVAQLILNQIDTVARSESIVQTVRKIIYPTPPLIAITGPGQTNPPARTSQDWEELCNRLQSSTFNSRRFNHIWNEHLQDQSRVGSIICFCGATFFFVSVVAYVCVAHSWDVWLPTVIGFFCALVVSVYSYKEAHPLQIKARVQGLFKRERRQAANVAPP